MTLLLGNRCSSARDSTPPSGASLGEVDERDGRGIGVTTRRALTLIDRGKEPFEAGRLVRQENPQKSAGNGA